MRMFKNILSLFPKKENITEISILSIYEILIYIGVFCLALWLYFSWTKVPEKSLNIECERIDVLFDFKDSDSIKLTSTGAINITFPLSEIITREDSLYYSHFWMENNEDSYLSDSRIHFNKIRKDKTNQLNHKLDSLLQIYTSFYQSDTIAFDSPLFYRRIESDITHISSSNLTKEFSEDEYSYGIKKAHISSDDKYVYESIGKQGFTDNINQEGTTMDKPSIFDRGDISQCYYRININSNTIDSIELNLSFLGANEFTFVSGIPTYEDCQDITYTIVYPARPIKVKRILNSHINHDIILHVKSKELENKQNARVFFVTAILSGLIVIFLAFIIIFFYRLFKSFSIDISSKENEEIVSGYNDSDTDKENQESTANLEDEHEQSTT